MPAISAVDTIGPAIQRTRTFLFRPFRLPTFLKLSLVAMLTEGFGGNFNFNFPLSGGHASSHSRFDAHFVNLPSALAHPTPRLIAALALVFIILCFFLYYLVTRLRFAYFHCLIHNIKEIRPGWRLYRTQASRFFWLNVIVGFCFLLFVAILALPFVIGFLRLFHHTSANGHPNIGLLLSLFLPLIPIIFLLVFAGIAADIILRDFMLPHFALEDATPSQAWASVWARIRIEKAPFFVYALLRVILPIAAMIGAFLILLIPMIVLIAVFAAIAFAVHSAIAGATAGAAILGILLAILAGMAAVGIALLVSLFVGGPVCTAIRQYALLFYGMRYERLGAILFPLPTSP
jgi:hypothetical protein